VCQISLSLGICLKNCTLSKFAHLLDTASKFALFSVSGLNDEKLITKQDWIVQCFTSPPTQYRLYGRQFLQVKRPNQQYQSTEGKSTKKITQRTKQTYIKLYNMRNTTVLTLVSWSKLIHTVHYRQLCFIGHMLHNTHSTRQCLCTIYQPAHGTTRRGHPRLCYVNDIKRLTGMRTNELVEVSQDRASWHELVVASIDPQLHD